MTERIIARGLMADKSAKIEGLLRKLGAQGTALKELRSSISGRLTEEMQAQIKHVHFLRNKGVHDEDFHISEEALKTFVSTADALIFSLELMLSKNSLAPLQTYTGTSNQDASSDSNDQIDVAARRRQAEQDEAERNRKFAEIENRRLAMEMDTKSAGISLGTKKPGMSPEMKSKVKQEAMKLGALFVMNLFKK